jgi:hypothetical protein
VKLYQEAEELEKLGEVERSCSMQLEALMLQANCGYSILAEVGRRGKGEEERGRRRKKKEEGRKGSCSMQQEFLMLQANCGYSIG